MKISIVKLINLVRVATLFFIAGLASMVNEPEFPEDLGAKTSGTLLPHEF